MKAMAVQELSGERGGLARLPGSRCVSEKAAGSKKSVVVSRCVHVEAGRRKEAARMTESKKAG